MKKITILMLVLTFVTSISFNLYSAGAEDISSQKSKEYVITPISPEWKNFKSVDLKNMLNISVEEAQQMDTATLLDFVLKYPFLGDIYAFNNPLKAIDFIAEQFNGLDVLLKREDLKEELIKSYINSSDKIITQKDSKEIDTEERYMQKYRESFLSYPTIYNKLSKTEKDTITSISKKVATRINTYPLFNEPGTQSPDAITYGPGDIIRIGTVFTPLLSMVEVYELEDMSSGDKNVMDNYMDSRYPNATRLRSATFKYNCHSYAWNSTSTSNKWWMDDPSAYMTDGSYSKTTAAGGWKIFYTAPGNEHSGIISSVNGNTVLVTSKWGAYGLYRHEDWDCPYLSPYLNTYWKLGN